MPAMAAATSARHASRARGCGRPAGRDLSESGGRARLPRHGTAGRRSGGAAPRSRPGTHTRPVRVARARGRPVVAAIASELRDAAFLEAALGWQWRCRDEPALLALTVTPDPGPLLAARSYRDRERNVLSGRQARLIRPRRGHGEASPPGPEQRPEPWTFRPIFGIFRDRHQRLKPLFRLYLAISLRKTAKRHAPCPVEGRRRTEETELERFVSDEQRPTSWIRQEERHG